MNIQDRLREVTPTATEIKSTSDTADRVLELVSSEMSKHSVVVGAELGGSYAKGTWLAGETDIDVFVKFDSGVSKEHFCSISKSIGFDAMAGYDPTERYADHPYVEAKIDGILINVVPCYAVRCGEWKSTADRSPYHTRFMCENLHNLRDDVRLLKKFLKIRGLYGAQIAVQGFSGYATEALILYFGGFENTIRQMADTKRCTIGKSTRKFETPISIIDPIDENRNLAAAISNRNMALFILRCREMAANPEANPLTVKTATPKIGWENVVSVWFGRGDENPEIIWGQARKTAAAMARHMRLNGFTVIRHKVLVDDGGIRLLFLTESIRIPERVVRTGPDILRKSEAAKFAGQGGMIWVSPEMKLLRMEEREHFAAALLRQMLRNPTKVGIPANLHAYISEGASVTVGGRIPQSVKEEAAELVCADESIFSYPP